MSGIPKVDPRGPGPENARGACPKRKTNSGEKGRDQSMERPEGFTVEDGNATMECWRRNSGVLGLRGPEDIAQVEVPTAKRKLGSGSWEVGVRLQFRRGSSKSDFQMGKSNGPGPREEIAIGRCSRFCRGWRRQVPGPKRRFSLCEE